MADKPLPWFRAYPEAAHDPKFAAAAIQTGLHPLLVFGAWIKLLCMAGNSPVRGSLYVTALKRYSNADVTALLQLNPEEWSALSTAFAELEMLETDDNGGYKIKNWDKRQYQSDNSAERVQKHREKAKTEECNSDVTLHDRYSNADVTPPEDRGQRTDIRLQSTEDREQIKETDPEAENPLFETFRQIIEGQGILMRDNNDSEAIREMVTAGITTQDLMVGIEWKAANNHDKPIYRASQLVGPSKTAKVKRLQNGNGHKPATQKKWNYDHTEFIEVPV